MLALAQTAEGLVIEARDQDLRVVGQRAFGVTALATAEAASGARWVLTPEGARLLDAELALSPPIREAEDEGLELRALTCVDDDLLLLRQHPLRAAMAPAMLSRIGANGAVRWVARLPPTSVAHPGVRGSRRRRRAWSPTTWLHAADSLTVSGDRALVTLGDMPRSGVGVGFVISSRHGEIVFTTAAGPIDQVAGLDDGRFLVGYEGYGDFDTLRYGRDGRVEDAWASHGFYVVDGTDVRVVETRGSTASKSHLARLESGGRVRRGAELPGYYTSPPLVRADGSLIFVRAGQVFFCRDLEVIETTTISGADARSSAFECVAAGGFTFVPLKTSSRALELLRIEVD